jgi:hypothetical protein
MASFVDHLFNPIKNGINISNEKKELKEKRKELSGAPERDQSPMAIRVRG